MFPIFSYTVRIHLAYLSFSHVSTCINMCIYVYLCNTCSICMLSLSYHAAHHFQFFGKIITHVNVPVPV